MVGREANWSRVSYIQLFLIRVLVHALPYVMEAVPAVLAATTKRLQDEILRAQDGRNGLHYVGQANCHHQEMACGLTERNVNQVAA